MKTTILIALLFFNSFSLFAQNDSINSKNYKHTNLTAYLIELMQLQGKDSILYDPSNLGYSIIIPKWWHIIEPPSPLIFGGSFPAVDSIENAMAIKSFPKENFNNSYNKFIGWVIKDYKLGDIPEWSNSHKILLIKELNEFENLGPSYKVQLLRLGNIYHCCYILTETPKAYVWLDFTATETTYDVNLSRFKELVDLFKIIE